MAETSILPEEAERFGRLASDWWDPDGAFPASELAGQVRQALSNIIAVLAEAGAGPEHVVRLTWYVTDRDEYVASAKEIGEAYRDVMGRVYPAMAVVAVTALVSRPDGRSSSCGCLLLDAAAQKIRLLDETAAPNDWGTEVMGPGVFDILVG